MSRIASMSPEAVQEAKIFNGRMHYFDGEKKQEHPEFVAVNVGKWTNKGAEREPADWLCTYYTALALGYEAEWMPTNGDDRDLLIFGRDDEGKPVALTIEEANGIARAINVAFKLAVKTGNVPDVD